MAYDRIKSRYGRNRGRNSQPLTVEQRDWRGVNYIDDIYSRAEHQLPFAQNVDLGNPIGSITKRAGRESLFTSLGTGQVLGLHAWEHSDGDKLLAAWGKNLYLLSGESGSVAKSSQADWEAGTLDDLDTTSSPGDVKLVKGTDVTDSATTTADFDGTHSDTQAYNDSVVLSGTVGVGEGISSLGTSSYSAVGERENGWAFTVGANDITVTKLRVRPYVIAVPTNRTIRLWQSSDRSLLRSVSVVAANSAWVEGAITPITLTAGASYVISIGTLEGDYIYVSSSASTSFNPAITFVEGRIGTIGQFPVGAQGGSVLGVVDIVSEGNYAASGVYTHGELDVSAVEVSNAATIAFNTTTPAGTTLTVEVRVSTDEGATWGAWAAKSTGDTIITAGTDISDYRVQWRANLASSDSTVSPSLDDVTVAITAGYHTPGTWLSPVYDLGNTPLTATLSWVQTVPAGADVTWYAKGSGNGTVFGDWQEILTSGDAIPLQRYIQIKAVLTGTVAATPTASSLLISYSTSYTQANKLDISPLGRTDNELTGNRVWMQDYGDNCYCADGLRPFVLYVTDDTATTGTAQAGAATTIRLEAGASAVDDFYNNAFITITGGTGEGQVRFISDYDGTTKDIAVAAWTTNPDATSTYSISSAVKVRKAGVDPPGTAPSLAAGAGTGLTGTYYAKVTFVNADGYESNPSDASAAVTVSNKNIVHTIPVDSSAGNTTTQRKVYRTKAGGSVYYYVATVDDNTTTTYTDAAADGTLTELMLDNNNIPPNASLVYEFLSYMFYANNDELWFSKAGEPEQVPNITGDRTLIVCPSTILDIKSNPMALIPQGENFIAPITTNSGFIFDSDPTVDTTTMRMIDKNGCLSAWASDICIDPQLRSILVFPTNTGVRLLLPGLQEESIESVPMSRNIQSYYDRTVNRGNMAGVFFNSYYILSMEYQDPDAPSSEWVTFCYDFRIGEWYGPWTFGTSCYCISGNVLYAGDPESGKIYQMFSGSSDDGVAIEMIADLPMLSLAENRTYKFDRFMVMVSANSNTAETTIAAKVDDREAVISLGALSSGFTGSRRPGHDNIRSKKYKIPLARGSTLSFRVEDDSTNPISLQKLIVECEVLPLKN